MKVQTSAQLKCFDRILIELRMNQFNCTYIMPNDNKDIPTPTNLNELKQLFKEEFGIQTGFFSCQMFIYTLSRHKVLTEHSFTGDEFLVSSKKNWPETNKKIIYLFFSGLQQVLRGVIF